MPNLTVGLGAAWAGCTVGRGYVRNLQTAPAHANGGMIIFEMRVTCNYNDNTGTINVPGCTETVPLPYSCVSLDPMSIKPLGETAQDLTQAANGKYCWGGAIDKSLWFIISRQYSSYDECKQKCAQEFYQNLYDGGLTEDAFSLVFPDYLN